MSWRPTDWSPLTGSDPVPGDPDEIERVAKSLIDMAEEITRQTANLRKLSTAEGWDADAGRTFADSAADLAGQLGKAHGRYATAGGALKGYAPELRHAQTVADTALADAKAAQFTINANHPSANPPAGSPSPEEATAERNRQTAYDGGISALQAAQRKLAQATDHRDEYAGRAARTIHDSSNGDGLNDSWWDKVKDVLGKIAEGLEKIAEVMGWILLGLAVIALFIVCLPESAIAAAILAGIAEAIAFGAMIAAAALVLAAIVRGVQGSWGKAMEDLLGAALFGLGGVWGSVRRAVERVAEEAAAKKAAEAAAKRAAEQAAKKKTVNEAIDKARVSANSGTKLEGEVGDMIRDHVVDFNRKVGPNGSVGQVDVETEKTIIEVTTVKNNKLGQIVKEINNSEINPSKKPVILYAPDYNRAAGVAIEKTGGYVARTPEELKALLKRFGEG